MLFMWFIGKSRVLSIIDPMFNTFIMSGFANAIPLFLFFTGNCNVVYLLFFLISEGSFWIGFCLIYNNRIRFKNHNRPSPCPYSNFLFKFSFVFYVGITLLTYVKFGIPLLMSNRNDVYANSGGWGILAYFSSFSFNYVLFYTVDQIIRKKHTRKAILRMLLLLVFIFLGGSKSGILGIVFCFFIYSYYYLGRKITIKPKYYALIAVFPVLVVLANGVTTSMSASAIEVTKRFMLNGDCYVMAYPSKDIDRIKINNPVLYTFSPILRALRIVDYPKDTALPIGNKLVYEVLPEAESAGLTTAPNTRPPLWAWACFRWYGCLFTFFFGMLIAWCMSRVRAKFKHNIWNLTLFYTVFNIGMSGITDVFLFFSGGVTIFLNLILYGGLIFFYKIIKKQQHVLYISSNSSL